MAFFTASISKKTRPTRGLALTKRIGVNSWPGYFATRNGSWRTGGFFSTRN
jgi:hypothetical protein